MMLNKESKSIAFWLWFAGPAALAAMALTSCGRNQNAQAAAPEAVTVGVVSAGRKVMDRQLTVSSELVPFQEIDVYAKQSGYVKQLFVDYGSRVKAGQLMAVLEIPELQAQLEQDTAAIRNMADQVTHAKNELARAEAQHQVLHLQYARLNSVATKQPGLVAQQEVDDAQGRDLAAEAQVEAAKSALESAESELAISNAKRGHDQVLFDYSRITAPFAGVVTQRYANLGTLMQAGTNSSTQALPLVQLSQEDRFRLVIPVPESYVKYIRIGDPADVRVPSLGKSFPGKVARFSTDVKEDTRTMHTEVDVTNPHGQLMAGLYAEAVLTLERKARALAVPLQAINHEGDQMTVYVIDPSNKIDDRPVTVGLQTVGDAEILSGLKDGDLVIVTDRSGLKAGEEVNPQVVKAMQYQGAGS